ncbi:hypothetical protein [Pseudooceanicola sp. HF7]|uniref:hypothetical protein n=1 Tax=Pseudooceanicola sp. HF7 TaxID=2721560 RepID=UPI00142F4816|nr:hypothetical protein [Pseudooceanicola sp. HF7]NIZ10645.1 hypothetical protein [Pseudooceanicola sp. HF7]
MSDTDSFIDEVNDELRRDRLYGMFRRYGWIAILVVLLIVAGAAANEWYKARQAAEAQAFGDAILAALDSETPEARVSALEQIETLDNSQETLVALLAASEAAAAGDRAQGADLLEGLNTEGMKPIYGQLATFKKLMMEAETTTPAERREGFMGLIAPGAPLRLLAEEQIALTYIEEDNTAEALESLQAILADAEATQGLQQRVTQLIVALGGTPGEAG